MLELLKVHLVHRIYRKLNDFDFVKKNCWIDFESICLVGSNPSHLIKSNVLHNDVRRYCHGRQWCLDGNKTSLCPLYELICHKATNTLCSSGDAVDNVRIEPGVPGLKEWQLSSE